MSHHSYAPAGTPAAGSCFLAKDSWSALTHFIGFLYSIFLTPLLLVHASQNQASSSVLTSLSVFMLSMALLFGASTAYHTLLVAPRTERLLKKLDHSMIYVLIAGSYTPICTALLPTGKGTVLLAAVWGVALLGIVFKLCWVTCPKWVSSVIYIAMGWSCLAVLPDLLSILSPAAFGLLLLGGLFYTFGGVLYALRLKRFNARCPNFGSHEVFHVAVMLGSLCHYFFMFLYIR